MSANTKQPRLFKHANILFDIGTYSNFDQRLDLGPLSYRRNMYKHTNKATFRQQYYFCISGDRTQLLEAVRTTIFDISKIEVV